MIIQNTKDLLKNYIDSNEVVYQVCGDLIEVSNDGNFDNRQALLEYISNASNITSYEKGASLIHNAFEELDNWATPDDVLFLLEPGGVLLCIPRRDSVGIIESLL